MDSFPMAWK